jgi:CBS domain-containing protein
MVELPMGLQTPLRKPVKKRKFLRRLVMLVLLCLWLGTAWWHTVKPLPKGVHVHSELLPVSAQSVHFLADVTAASAFGEPLIKQTIHAATLNLVRDAKDFLILDYFLFNSQGGPSGELSYTGGIRPAARELREALLAVRAAQPKLPMLVIVDPINGYYSGAPPEELAPLRQAGIDVIVTNLDPLRDSNALYSAAWRLLLGWWLKPGVSGFWSNPLDAGGPALSLGAISRLPHFKANHRKVAITGDGAGSLIGIISSGNPHDASSAHSNVALRIHGEALRTLVDSELAIARWSGRRTAGFSNSDVTQVGQDNPIKLNSRESEPAPIQVGIVTEGAIRAALLDALSKTVTGDSVDIAQFYLTDRKIIEALLVTAQRGCVIRIILDPNKDAFGFEKSGLPNREVASELVVLSNGAIKVRWYRTHGEQFHTKMAAVRHDNTLWLTVGSANFTRRNLGDYNLEANAIVTAPIGGELDVAVATWFETFWDNRPGAGVEYTADTDVYADPSQGRYWLYRLMERSGLSTF